MKAQRLRFRYRLTDTALGLKHRDIVDAWTNALAAAGLPVATTEGKRPAPLISLGPPLPLGATSDCELADVHFAERVDPERALCQIAGRFPPGIEPFAVQEVGVAAPSLQSDIRWAEYVVDVPASGHSEAEVRNAIAALLAERTLPSEYRRETKTRLYDLRPLVLDIRLETATPEQFRLRLRLRAEQEATARADQTVLALGLPEPTRVHRTRLAVSEIQPALAAYRRAGEPEDDR